MSGDTRTALPADNSSASCPPGPHGGGGAAHVGLGLLWAMQLWEALSRKDTVIEPELSDTARAWLSPHVSAAVSGPRRSQSSGPRASLPALTASGSVNAQTKNSP